MDHDDFLQLPKESQLPHMNITCRQFMQMMGRFLRDIEPQHMINMLKARMQPAGSMTNLLFSGHLVTDVRLPAEADWIRAQGGTVIHILRDQAPTTHPDITEQNLPIEQGDIVITNNSTVDELHSKLRDLATDLRSGQAA